MENLVKKLIPIDKRITEEDKSQSGMTRIDRFSV